MDGFARQLSLTTSIVAIAGAWAATALWTQTAVAQTEEEEEQAIATAIEEIVVTSRKRGAEALQDVPAAVTAIGTETLDVMSIQNFEDFAYFVPGLTFTDTGPGEKRYIIRGIQSAGQQQVAVYYDEVPLPGVQSATSDSGSQTTDLYLYDMERIEVLRGPQGTTFGANSQSGTVRFITAKPNLQEYEGSIFGSVSSTTHGGENWETAGMLNMPIIENKLGIRIVPAIGRQSGFIENFSLGRLDKAGDDEGGGVFLKNFNWNEFKSIRANLRWQPVPELTIDGTIWLQDRDSGGADRFHPFDTIFDDSLTQAEKIALSSDQGGRDNVPEIARFQTGQFRVGDFTQTPKPDDQQIYALTAEYEMPWATLTAAGSLYERDFRFAFDSTWIILFLGAAGAGRDDLFPALTDQTQSLDQWTGEVRLNSTHPGPIQWVFGGFVRDRESEFQSFVPVVDNDTGLPFDPGTPFTGNSSAPGAGIPGCHPCVFAREASKDIEEQAVFGELSYEITPELEALVGLRWFRVEQADFGQTVFQFALFGGGLPPALTETATEDRLIKKFQLSWKPEEDITLFALASQGFRLGGTNNQGVADIPDLFEADELWNFELGAKTAWFDDRLVFNTNLFWLQWDNLQVDADDPTGAFGFITNAGEAEVIGLEAEMFASPTPDWNITANLTWLPKKELTEDQTTTVIIGGDEVTLLAPGKDGDEIPRIPELTASATIQRYYDIPVARDWRGWIRGEVFYRGSSRTELRPFETGNINDRDQDSFAVVNLRAGFDNQDLDGTITVFVENIFDKQGDVFLGVGNGQPTFKVTNRPRTIGIEVNKYF